MITLDYSSLVPAGTQIDTFTLGIGADDFQFPVWGQPFLAYINGTVDAALENTLNGLVQTGPVVQFFSIGVDPASLNADNVLTLTIDEGGDGGDGWAVDFLTVGVQTSTAATKVDGLGAFDNQGNQVTFKFYATQKINCSTLGHFSFCDPAAGVCITRAEIRNLSITGNTADFSGPAHLEDGTRVRFTVSVTDNGEPGTSDTISISLTTGYSVSGPHPAATSESTKGTQSVCSADSSCSTMQTQRVGPFRSRCQRHCKRESTTPYERAGIVD